MKRFHFHLEVEDQNASLAFDSKLFGAKPSVPKESLTVPEPAAPMRAACC